MGSFSTVSAGQEKDLTDSLCGEEFDYQRTSLNKKDTSSFGQNFKRTTLTKETSNPTLIKKKSSQKSYTSQTSKFSVNEDEEENEQSNSFERRDNKFRSSVRIPFCTSIVGYIYQKILNA